MSCKQPHRCCSVREPELTGTRTRGLQDQCPQMMGKTEISVGGRGKSGKNEHRGERATRHRGSRRS